MTSPVPDERPTAPAAPSPSAAAADAAAPSTTAADVPPAAPPGAAPPPAGAGAPPVPVPPRSRAGAHVLSVLVGLILTPVGLAALASGAHGIATALESAGDVSTTAIGMVGAGAVLLGLVAAAAGGSTLGPIVGGALYGIAPGLGFLLSPRSIEDTTTSLLDPVSPVTGDGLRDGAIALGSTGALVLLGLTLVLVGVAAHLARRAGRRSERIEAALVAASSHVPVGAPGARPIIPPTPPHSRLPAHGVSAGLGVVLTPIGLCLVAAGAVDLAVSYATGDPVPVGTLVWPWAAGLALVGAVVVAAGWSTLGLLIGGTVFGLVPGLLGVLSPEWTDRGIGHLLTWLGDVMDPDAAAGLYALVTLGIVLAWGAVATLGAVGTHVARRDGRRRERSEIAVARGATAAR